MKQDVQSPDDVEKSPTPKKKWLGEATAQPPEGLV